MTKSGNRNEGDETFLKNKDSSYTRNRKKKGSLAGLLNLRSNHKDFANYHERFSLEEQDPYFDYNGQWLQPHIFFLFKSKKEQTKILV